MAYAEEGGDFAQLREVDACMEVSEILIELPTSGVLALSVTVDVYE